MCGESNPQNNGPFQEPFIQQFKSVVIGLVFLVIIFIGVWNSGWEGYVLNFLLSFLFLTIVVPNLLKARYPNLDMNQALEDFMGFENVSRATGFQAVMGYLSHIATISLCYTVLGYLHFKLGWFTPEAWPFAAAFFILILLVLSSLTIFELMYNLGLFEPNQNIRSVALAMLVAVIAFGVQALFLKIGVDAINQYKIKETTAMECDVSLEEFEKPNKKKLFCLPVKGGK